MLALIGTREHRHVHLPPLSCPCRCFFLDAMSPHLGSHCFESHDPAITHPFSLPAGSVAGTVAGVIKGTAQLALNGAVSAVTTTVDLLQSASQAVMQPMYSVRRRGEGGQHGGMLFG